MTFRSLPHPLNVLVIRDIEPEDVVARIQAVAPDRLRVTRVREMAVNTPEEEAAVRQAHVALIGANCPNDLGSRMPHALWIHANFSGISELRDRDFWGGDIPMTSSRGHTSPLPIAETALAGALMMAKNLHLGARTVATRRVGREAFRPWLIGAQTMGIVGLGGIGSELARMARGVGMRVIASRRSTEHRTQNIEGVDELFPASDLLEMAKQSHILVLCLPATPDTDRLIDAKVMDALPQGAIIVNVARGELIDDDALVEALDSGKLGGAYLDVYAGEREQDPDPRLANHPKVVMTPHIAQRSHIRVSQALNVFCDNLRRFLDGKPLESMVDWKRGY